MGIRIRGNYANSAVSNPAENIRGYKISASTNKTYDLDEIFSNAGRSNSSSPLLLQVKDNSTIKEAVLEKFIAKTKDTVNSVISDEREAIYNMISNAMEKYNIADINSSFFESFVLKSINSELNAYLKNKIKQNLLFNLTIEGTTKTININYDFVSETSFENALASVYNKYKNEVISTDVGGVAIYGNKTGDITSSNSDYKKYLIDSVSTNGGFTQSSSTPGTRKPLVIWSSGSDDTTEDEETSSIYDIINSMQKKLDYLYKYKADDIIPTAPSDDGDYFLKVCVRNGIPAYSWETNNQVKIIPAENDYFNAEYTNLKLVDIVNETSKNAVLPDGDYKILPDGTFNFVMYRYNVEE